MKGKIIKQAIINAVATMAYILVVSSLLFYGPKFFDAGKPDTILVPIFMLSLLVFSVAIVGLLIFGRPILWYWDRQKREAITLIIYTLGTFFIIVLIVFGTLLLSR